MSRNLSLLSAFAANLLVAETAAVQRGASMEHSPALAAMNPTLPPEPRQPIRAQIEPVKARFLAAHVGMAAE